MSLTQGVASLALGWALLGFQPVLTKSENRYKLIFKTYLFKISLYWIIVQTEYNQACLNCWGAADNARAELSYCFVPTFFRTTNDRIINVSCASLTPFGVIYGSQVCEWGFIPNSHAWFPYATISNFARRRCAIGPRRIAVFIEHAFCFYMFDSYRAINNL